MEIIYGIIADLPSKQFGNTTLYFDKDGQEVVAIDQSEKITYAVIDKNNKVNIITAMIDGVRLSCAVDSKDIFVIPQIQDRLDITFLTEETDMDEYANQQCDLLYEVVNYGMLDWPNFRGALFSRAKINVAVMNPQGEVYQICMTVGEGVRGCDGNPHGDIDEAYKIRAIGRFLEDGIFIATI